MKDLRLSWPVVLTIVSMLVSLAAVWGSSRTALAAMQDRQMEQRQELREVRQEIASLRDEMALLREAISLLRVQMETEQKSRERR